MYGNITMANSAKFNRQEVVDKATNLYWKQGFHATSMRNLQDEIDMRPGSIYTAFGSKNGLFTEALRNYTDMVIAQLNQFRDEANSPIEALKAFMKALVIDTQCNAPNGMCMLTKTIGELNDEHQELIDITKDHLGEVSTEFADIIEEAKQTGELSQYKNTHDLASHVQIQITGLRTYAKLQPDQEKLEAMIDDIFNHHPFC